MSVQDHYDNLKGELPGDTEVNLIGHRSIEVDLGDSLTLKESDIALRVVKSVKRNGYEINGEPFITAGYRGACDEALLLHIPIERIEDY